MDRLTLVKQVMTYKNVITSIDPDIFNICQSHWDEFNKLWTEMKGMNQIKVQQMVNDGPWSDSELRELIEQIELMIMIMNQGISDKKTKKYNDQ